MALKAVDLFCGAGGLSRGLIEAGFEIAAAIDSWEIALRSYRANFSNHAALTADVSTLTVEGLREAGVPADLDLVAGGPPCQGFSIQRIGDDVDNRNDLVLAFGHVVAMLHPRAFLMENVPGLLGRRGKHLAQKFIRTMTAVGYDINYAVVDAADFGVPQTRRRVFFVGWDRMRLSEFTFPASAGSRKAPSVRQAIGDLPSPPHDFFPLPGDPLHRRIRLSAKNLERLKHVPPGGGFEDLPVALRVNCHKKGASRIGHRAVYGRLDPDRPAATITARFDSFTRGRFGHPWEDRNITLREGARLQGFADCHTFFGTQEEIAAQIGNAIPPPLAGAFGIALRQYLEGRSAQPTHSQLTLPLEASGQLTVAA
jgi:DNA (cytosine-5)-methyltransferase 1